jgi:hypothetical protein
LDERVSGLSALQVSSISPIFVLRHSSRLNAGRRFVDRVTKKLPKEERIKRFSALHDRYADKCVLFPSVPAPPPLPVVSKTIAFT